MNGPFIVWQGILDDQFSQLQMLQDESTPDFVEEVVTLFFDDSVKLLENLTESLYVLPDLDLFPTNWHIIVFTDPYVCLW